jgi:hypothetical protein
MLNLQTCIHFKVFTSISYRMINGHQIFVSGWPKFKVWWRSDDCDEKILHLASVEDFKTVSYSVGGKGTRLFPFWSFKAWTYTCRAAYPELA